MRGPFTNWLNYESNDNLYSDPILAVAKSDKIIMNKRFTGNVIAKESKPNKKFLIDFDIC
jgi:hypothetical protein